jgi:hypothetical protein
MAMRGIERTSVPKSSMTSALTSLFQKIVGVHKRIKTVLTKARSLASVRNMKRNMATVEKKIGSEGWMERMILARFTSGAEHGPGTRPWAPRVVQGDGHPVLVKTGALREASKELVAGTWRFYGANWSQNNLNSEYGSYIQNGTHRMTARPFMDKMTKGEERPIRSRALELLREEYIRQMDGSAPGPTQVGR